MLKRAMTESSTNRSLVNYIYCLRFDKTHLWYYRKGVKMNKLFSLREF